jgi:para-aminobenzoate synthetase / 4-amino-4-deoxychorismate lyase
MNGIPRVILQSYAAGESHAFRFSGLIEQITAETMTEVIPALRKVEDCVARGYHAAGFLSYEAAAAFDSTLITRPPGEFPLLWFGIFAERRAAAATSPVKDDTASGPEYVISNWSTSVNRAGYDAVIDRIKEYIAAGDTYQVNYTLRQRFNFTGNVQACYLELCRSQRASYCAFLDLDRYGILSTSPELFFRLKDGLLTTRPMKGTAKRGRWTEEDAELMAAFKQNVKERAENLMIVDLLRNDMGRVSETGSVQVASLFDVERLETVQQMTSTITSRVKADTGIVELFRALFPCGSITGAPKKRTMEIIAELEDSPRGLYTGCIGYLSPGGEALFSVAIRTLVIDKQTGNGELGLGSGITWDSVAGSEYEECLAKGRFVLTPVPEFKLLESLLFEEATGFYLLERHLQRLSRSVAYFGFELDPDYLRKELEQLAAVLQGSHKVRILLARHGSFSITSEPIIEKEEHTAPVVALAEVRVNTANPFLYHKTDNRAVYASELAKRPDCVDVIFINERNEVAEGANNNIVVRINGGLFTPPRESGLLPGTFREELLANGEIRERIITRKELERATDVYLINSVRKWRKVRLI